MFEFGAQFDAHAVAGIDYMAPLNWQCLLCPDGTINFIWRRSLSNNPYIGDMHTSIRSL